MWLAVVGTALPMFSLGFAVANRLWKKRLDTLVKDHSVEMDRMFNNSFEAGWHSASTDVTNVKTSYDKLVNPLKYRPNNEI